MTTVIAIALDESGAGWRDFAGQLPEAERRRAESFRFDADRLRFARCRATLRRALGERLGLAPEAVEFEFGPHGKPSLAGAVAGRWQFNVSHTRGAALIALAEGAEIGVDVERERPMADMDAVARRVFTKREQEGLRPLAGRARAARFFQLWTAKEAFLKALGTGLTLAPARVECRLPGEGGALGVFACGGVAAAAALRCVQVTIPGATSDLHATLCAPEALCAHELEIEAHVAST